MTGVELLSPAGNKECLKAAVANGCGAVYFGGQDFNARRSAGNFEDGELEQMIDYCHLRGVKAYIVVNTLYLESEFERLVEFVKKAYSYGADAFIVCDMGLVGILSRHFKGIELHASTQLSAHSVCDVMYLDSLGFTRINIARETPLNNTQGQANGPDTVEDIVNCTKSEIEVFAHGALCVCYSGRCLMSAFFGGRSGNRGDCAQPCRQKYTLCSPDGEPVKTGYLLSPKDLCTVQMLPDIISSGVTSLKIEGRMKGPQYCAITSSAYRSAIDSSLSGTDILPDGYEKELLQVFNRGGSFTKGYYALYSGFGMMSPGTSKATGLNTGQVLRYDEKTNMCTVLLKETVIPGDGIEISGSGTYVSREAAAGSIMNIKITGEIKKGDTVYKTYGKAVMDKAAKSYEKDTRKLGINGRIYARRGEKLMLELSFNGIVAKAYSTTPDEAKNKPLDRDEFIMRLSKTGDYPVTIDFTEAVIEDGIFIPVAVINKLRRDAVELFCEKYVQSFKRKVPEYVHQEAKRVHAKSKKLTVLVSDKGQLEAVIELRPYIIYAPASGEILENIEHYSGLCHTRGVKLFIALPHITVSTNRMELLINELEATGIDGYLVRTMGQLHLLADTEKETVLDYTLNTFNPYAASAYPESFTVTASVELDPGELGNFGENTESIIYGKIPLMVTRQCPVGNYAGRGEEKVGPYCTLKGHDKNFTLIDRKNSGLTVSCDCENCYALLYSHKPIPNNPEKSNKELAIKSSEKHSGLNRKVSINQDLAKCLDYGVSRLRLQFTDEDLKLVRKLTSSLKDSLASGKV